ncbi:MAG: hypothetical protein ACP5NS_04280 [Candidatus Pacearchaeota archaeon]
MKEMSEKSGHNSAGVVGVVFGILSLVAFLIPVLALILSIVGFVFAWNQKKKMPNSWATAGLWLNGLAFIIGVAWNIYYVLGIIKFASQYQQQLQGLSQQAGAIDPSAYANYGN